VQSAQPTKVGLDEQSAFRHYLQCLHAQVTSINANSFDEAVALEERRIEDARTSASRRSDRSDRLQWDRGSRESSPIERQSRDRTNTQRDNSERFRTTYRYRNTAWPKALRRAGVPYFRIYDLRSTYATRLSAGGVADEWVIQLLRQGDSHIFKKYSQMKLQMKREALEKINRRANEMSLNPKMESGTAMIQ
jgi:integrase